MNLDELKIKHKELMNDGKYIEANELFLDYFKDKKDLPEFVEQAIRIAESAKLMQQFMEEEKFIEAASIMQNITTKLDEKDAL